MIRWRCYEKYLYCFVMSLHTRFSALFDSYQFDCFIPSRMKTLNGILKAFGLFEGSHINQCECCIDSLEERCWSSWCIIDWRQSLWRSKITSANIVRWNASRHRQSNIEGAIRKCKHPRDGYDDGAEKRDSKFRDKKSEKGDDESTSEHHYRLVALVMRSVYVL